MRSPIFVTRRSDDKSYFYGALVTTKVINSVAKGFIIANDWSLLIENGVYISLSHQWGRNVLYRTEQEGKKMCRWKATTEKIPVVPGLLKKPSYIWNDKLNKCKSGIKYQMTWLSTSTRPFFRMYVSRTTLSILKVVRVFLFLEKESANRSLVLFVYEVWNILTNETNLSR